MSSSASASMSAPSHRRLAAYAFTLAIAAAAAVSTAGASSNYTTSFRSVPYTPIPLTISVPSPPPSSPGRALYLTCPHESGVKDPGPVIYDSTGAPVWMDIAGAFAGGACYDLNVQTYEGEQYLTVWTGAVSTAGYGSGVGVMLDSTYGVVREVYAGEGLSADLHEFHIPTQTNSTALFTAYNPRQENLTAAGLSDDSWFLDATFQEVDIDSGDVVFSWSAFEHLPWWNETYATPSGSTGTGTKSSPWDAVHMNSVDKDVDGNYLISCRHFHQLYKIDKDSGDIVWRMGGMRSDFTMGNGTNYEWQHHARWVDNYTTITVFDNAASNWDFDEASARGLVLAVDQTNMSVSLTQDLYPVYREYSMSQGDVQLLDDGGYVLGFGSNPWIVEYAPNGTVVWAASIGPLGGSNVNGDVQNYRAFKTTTWIGTPHAPPDLAVSAADASAYVSWNGATEVATWMLVGADAADTFADFVSISNTSRDGFETRISLTNGSASDEGSSAQMPNFVAVIALAANGSALGQTGVYEVGNGKMLSKGSVVNGAWPRTVGAVPLLTGALAALVAMMVVV
ncbi:hypothetical protein M0805_002859 [Coniferiporia weirii]|nr:hypothetical protein M0805_002859 [Coniferiporia weirii]